MSENGTSYGSESGLPPAQVFWRTEFERIFLRGSGTARAMPQQPAATAQRASSSPNRP